AFAKDFSTHERTLRAWERGEREVPALVAFVVELALKDGAVRRKLGFPSTPINWPQGPRTRARLWTDRAEEVRGIAERRTEANRPARESIAADWDRLAAGEK